MISFDELNNKVSSLVSAYRYQHILRVVDRAVEYAKVYDVDIEKASLCALAHDIAKEMNYDEYNNLFDEYELLNPSLKHAKVGSILVKDYGFDSDMINSILYHTTGRENMSMLEKIIYLADATEAGRNIDMSIVDLVKRDINRAMVVVCSFTLNKLIEKKKIIHPNSINCYNYYVLECSKGESEYVQLYEKLYE